MHLALLILTIGGGIMLPLIWALTVWQKMRSFRKQLDQEQCKICGALFGESLYEIQGPIRGADRARLDKFQQQYAAYRVHCKECESINLCANNGSPMKAYPLVD